MGKIILDFDTNKPEPAGFITVDGAEYRLLDMAEYGLEAQAARYKLEQKTNLFLETPTVKSKEEARARLDDYIKLIVPTLPTEMIKALPENGKITLSNTYKQNWDDWAVTAYRVKDEDEGETGEPTETQQGSDNKKLV